MKPDHLIRELAARSGQPADGRLLKVRPQLIYVALGIGESSLVPFLTALLPRHIASFGDGADPGLSAYEFNLLAVSPD